MLRFFFSALIGYALGIFNPAALIAHVKKVNLRASGTGNLGAANVTLSIGKVFGAIVMFFDVGKAFAAVKLAAYLFPSLGIAGLTAGTFAVIGHIYPVHMKFKGGKGSAAFGGMVLALNPMMFQILLCIGILSMIASGYPVFLPLSAAAAAPLTALLYLHSLPAFLALLVVAALLLHKHRENFRRMRTGTEKSLRKHNQ